MAAEKPPQGFVHPVYWVIAPMYGVRFVPHMDGSLHIEMPPGKQMEVFTHVLTQLDVNRQKHVAETSPQKPDVSDNPETVKEISQIT
jgi:hypothetical protein